MVWSRWKRRPGSIIVPGHDVPMVLEGGKPHYIGKREAAITAWYGDGPSSWSSRAGSPPRQPDAQGAVSERHSLQPVEQGRGVLLVAGLARVVGAHRPSM